jgi:hypothetical protein
MKRGHTFGGCWSVSWVGVARVIPILSVDMGYARRGLQERERGWRMGGRTGESSMGVVSREW